MCSREGPQLLAGMDVEASVSVNECVLGSQMMASCMNSAVGC